MQLIMSIENNFLNRFPMRANSTPRVFKKVGPWKYLVNTRTHTCNYNLVNSPPKSKDFRPLEISFSGFSALKSIFSEAEK